MWIWWEKVSTTALHLTMEIAPTKIFWDLRPTSCYLDFNLLLNNNNINSLRFDNSYEIVNYLCGFGPKVNPWSKSTFYTKFVASLHSTIMYPWKLLKDLWTRVSKFLNTPKIIHYKKIRVMSLQRNINPFSVYYSPDFFSL